MNFDDRILSRDEIDALSLDALDGDTEALPLLIETHLRLFYKMAQKYKNILDPDESVSIMVENVIEKFPHKFKPDKGNFTKFAGWYALAGIQWYLRFRLRVVHFPQREDDRIVSEHDCDEISDEDANQIDPGDLEDMIADEHKEHARRLIRKRVGRLDPLEREIVRRRFGIGKWGKDHEPQTYRQIGDHVGYSYERVRQILNDCIRRIAPWFEEHETDVTAD